jgi:ATP-dependent RNA helicase RhlE
MHVEDYVHRIGRTGRANEIGDAISFVTREDLGELRALERFIGRGIVRKKAEGFNYNAAEPQFEAEPERRHPLPPRHQSHSRPSHHGGRPQGQQRHFRSR